LYEFSIAVAVKQRLLMAKQADSLGGVVLLVSNWYSWTVGTGVGRLPVDSNVEAGAAPASEAMPQTATVPM
jgi:hypothetical protein